MEIISVYQRKLPSTLNLTVGLSRSLLSSQLDSDSPVSQAGIFLSPICKFNGLNKGSTNNVDAFPLSHGPSLKEVYSALKEVWHNLFGFFLLHPMVILSPAQLVSSG